MKLTIFTKVLAAILLPSITIAALLTIILSSRIIDGYITYENKISELYAETITTDVQNTMAKLCRSVTESSAYISQIRSNMGNPRLHVDSYLKILIESHENIHNAWVVFEPDAFDNKDERFAGLYPNSPSGRLIKSYSIIDGTIVESFYINEVTIDSKEWYVLPKSDGRLYIDLINNQVYENGSERRYNTIAAPIMRDGKIIGCVGIDVDYNEIHKFSYSSSGAYQRCINIFAQSGMIMYTSDTRFNTSCISDIGFAGVDDILLSINEDKEYQSEAESPFFDNSAAVMRFIPVHFTFTDDVWTININTSLDSIYKETRNYLRMIFLLSIVVMIVLMVIAFYVSRNIVGPIKGITLFANQIANKSAEVHPQLFEKRNDEIGELSKSLVKMLDKLNESVNQERYATEVRSFYTFILTEMQNAEDTNGALNIITAYMGQGMEFDRIAVFEDPGNDDPRLISYWVSGPKIKIGYKHIMAFKVREKIKSADLIEFDAEDTPDIKNELQLNDDVLSALIVPINQQNAYSGFMILERVNKARKYSDEDKYLVKNIGLTLANLFVKAQIEQQKQSFAIELEHKVEERTNELQLMTIEANNATQAKSRFLASMSHEIRTPMNAILGMAELLLLEELNQRQHGYVGDIKTASTSLLNIINDILDVSKIEAGKLTLVKTHYHFPEFIENVRSIMQIAAEAKKLDIKVELLSTLPVCVYGDDVRLRQIMVNILSNAIKFTDVGQVKLSICCTEDRMIFEVTDMGIGIKEADLPKLFEAFEQMDMQKNRGRKGTGLGLAITKSLVEMMDGTISTTSVYGEGTTFHVELPLILGDESLIDKDSDVFTFISAPTAEVLLVDDVEVNLNVGRGLLSLCSIDCDTAMSGQEAIMKVREKDYDIVFMDHMMTDMSGVEATEEIRAMGGKYADIPIIALTANAIEGAREMFLNSGMNDYISKPIDKLLFNKLLKKWLPPEKLEEPERREAIMDVMTADLIPTLQKANEIEGLDVSQGLSLINGMQEVYERSLKLLMRKVMDSHEKLSVLLDIGDLEKFAVDAHGLKGALSMNGQTKLAELAEELELASKADDMKSCTEKLPDFLVQIKRFGEELYQIFDEGMNTEDREKGDNELLKTSLESINAAAMRFDRNKAMEGVKQLLKYSFGAETDQQIQRLNDCLEEFDYDLASEICSGLLT